MTTLKEICGAVNESHVMEYRYNVILKSELGGFKLFMETNINGISKADVVQKVRHHLDKMREQYGDVLTQKWTVHTITPIKPSQKSEHLRRMKNKQ